MFGMQESNFVDSPCRPILSAIGTANYKLAKYLVPFITPYTINQNTVKDTFAFVKDIINSSFPVCTMASFDIVSLYTQIPLNEALEICIEKVFHNSELVQGLNKQQFKQALEIATKEGFFLFDGQIYKQKDGLSMGSPLAPVLANMFLCHYEEKWLNECPAEFKPLLYKRYVDDTFLLFRDPVHIPSFLEYLNNKHLNIKFTSEIEINNTIPFLDIFITKESTTQTKFTTSVYRKKTFTGLTTKFDSCIPNIYKLNLISTLFNRAYNICSTYENLHKEIENISKILTSNNFPKPLIDKHIGKRLTLIRKEKNQPQQSVEKAKVFIPLYYIGPHSLMIKKTLDTLLRKFYPQINARIIFRTKRKLANFFQYKDSVEDVLRSMVVYMHTCPSCQRRYVGSTSRQLLIRIREHQGVSHRTKIPLSNPPYSAIREHADECRGPFTVSQSEFSILKTCSDVRNLTLAETLAAWLRQPELCKRTGVKLECFES